MMTAIRFSLLIFVLCGLVYPLVITGIGQWVFPYQANGSLIQDVEGKVIGSELLGQPFTQDQYFHPRPSGNNYDAANSGGSNYGATSQKLIDRATGDTEKYRQENQATHVPLDAVTASGSGLDPHISLENALVQVPRISKARGVDRTMLENMVHTKANDDCDGMSNITHACGLVNVLKLNLALDERKAKGIQ